MGNDFSKNIMEKKELVNKKKYIKKEWDDSQKKKNGYKSVSNYRS